MLIILCFVIILECPVPPWWHSSKTAWNYTEGLQEGLFWGARCHQCRSPWIGHPWSWPGDSVFPTPGMICYLSPWSWFCILFYVTAFGKKTKNLHCKLNWLHLLCLCSTQGCGVLHPPVRTHRSSRQDRSLHLLLPEEGRGPVALRGKQSSMFWRALLNCTLNWTRFLALTCWPSNSYEMHFAFPRASRLGGSVFPLPMTSSSHQQRMLSGKQIGELVSNNIGLGRIFKDH